jgi:hypothetical protein
MTLKTDMTGIDNKTEVMARGKRRKERFEGEKYRK